MSNIYPVGRDHTWIQICDNAFGFSIESIYCKTSTSIDKTPILLNILDYDVTAVRLSMKSNLTTVTSGRDYGIVERLTRSFRHILAEFWSGITKWIRVNTGPHINLLYLCLWLWMVIAPDGRLAFRTAQTQQLDVSPTLTTTEKCVKAIKQRSDDRYYKTVIYSPTSLARQLASYFRLV